MTRSKELPASSSATKPPPSIEDEKRFNDTLKRMLKTPPKPHEIAAKKKLTEADQKSKPGGNPAKNNRPEGQ